MNNIAMLSIIANAREVGRKKFASIPLTLLEVDDRYQRIDSVSETKINKLTQNFDINMMDAIRVAPHYDEGKFYILDGFHRFMAVSTLGGDFIEAEILVDLPEDPEERLICEAKYFSDQNDNVEKLTPQQKHNAYIIQGKEANVALDGICRELGLRWESKTKYGDNYLSGFTAALDIIDKSGANRLRRILTTIIEARWNLYTGIKRLDIKALNTIFSLHESDIDKIVEYVRANGKLVTNMDFHAAGNTYYKGRSMTERYTLAMEDWICAGVGLDTRYLPKVRGEIVTAA